MLGKSSIPKDQYMLKGRLAKKGFDSWWQSFTAINADTGETKQFYIEFFAVNPAYSEDYPVYGQDIENKLNGKLPSYLMVNVGCWGDDPMQLHRFFSLKNVEITYDKKTGFSISANDCILNETHSSGHVMVSDEDAMDHPEYMTDAGEISWDLDIDKKIAFHSDLGSSYLFRKLNAFEVQWHVEGMMTEFSGTIECNGIEYIVKDKESYGYSDKNWGKDSTSPFVWLTSNDLISNLNGDSKRLENSGFAILGGRPKFLEYLKSLNLVSQFCHEGKTYKFSFFKLFFRSKDEFECHETDDKIIWHVVQTGFNATIELDIVCLKKDMLLLNYETPSGSKLYNRLWNGGNGSGTLKLYKGFHNKKILIDDIIVGSAGCEYGTYGEFKEETPKL